MGHRPTKAEAAAAKALNGMETPGVFCPYHGRVLLRDTSFMHDGLPYHAGRCGSYLEAGDPPAQLKKRPWEKVSDAA